MGAASDEALTQAIGHAMGVELKAARFTLNFAPVVDVSVNPLNTAIGTRSYGDDPTAVGRNGQALARGLQSAGVIACLKHFPGAGKRARSRRHVFRHSFGRAAAEHWL